VLGAGSPAGRAIALALAGAGSDLAVASATTDGEEVMAVRRTRRAVEAAGARAVEYAFDTTLGQNVQVSTRQVTKELGGLNILVTAQSYPMRQPAERTSDSEWARSVALNLGGVFFACRAAAREMAGGGTIISVIPWPDEQAMAGAAAYTAAAYGVLGLTRALAAEYAARGIRVYALTTSEPANDGPGLHRWLRAADLGLEDEIGAVCVHLTRGGSAEAAGRLISVAAPA